MVEAFCSSWMLRILCFLQMFWDKLSVQHSMVKQSMMYRLGVPKCLSPITNSRCLTLQKSKGLLICGVTATWGVFFFTNSDFRAIRCKLETLQTFQNTNLVHNSFNFQQYICYTILLNMFRAARCSSSGGPIVSPQPLVSSPSVRSRTVCGWRVDYATMHGQKNIKLETLQFFRIYLKMTWRYEKMFF